MKTIYLIRHTTPAIAKGICYGQSDIDVTESFLEEAMLVKAFIPENIEHIYSSPLRRCSKLATYLFPNKKIFMDNDLMEIHCGSWEMRKWDEFLQPEIDPWMNDYLKLQTPGGESYIDLYGR